MYTYNIYKLLFYYFATIEIKNNFHISKIKMMFFILHKNNKKRKPKNGKSKNNLAKCLKNVFLNISFHNIVFAMS